MKTQDAIKTLTEHGLHELAMFVVDLNSEYQETQRKVEIYRDEFERSLQHTNDELRDKLELVAELQKLREEMKVMKQRQK